MFGPKDCNLEAEAPARMQDLRRQMSIAVRSAVVALHDLDSRPKTVLRSHLAPSGSLEEQSRPSFQKTAASSSLSKASRMARLVEYQNPRWVYQPLIFVYSFFFARAVDLDF